MGAKEKGGCAPGTASGPSTLCSCVPSDTSCACPGALELPKSSQAWLCSACRGAWVSSLGGQPRHSPMPACSGLRLPCAQWVLRLSSRIVQAKPQAKSASAHSRQFGRSVGSVFTTSSASDATAGKRRKTGVGTGLALNALFCPFPHWHELAATLQNGVTFWGRKVKNEAL